jgi:hypothetical protein
MDISCFTVERSCLVGFGLGGAKGWHCDAFGEYMRARMAPIQRFSQTQKFAILAGLLL